MEGFCKNRVIRATHIISYSRETDSGRDRKRNYRLPLHYTIMCDSRGRPSVYATPLWAEYVISYIMGAAICRQRYYVLWL